ncbi:SDR family NAD(P)-dependent oxidoreductase [Jiangella alkaliphila]|uniref:Short-chain dehydrogenase n=1 Tax=Jiangella alkaliphila TaxID=419479 RepID=A0A1H2GI04_9ACTN|nr:SDR family NAD(P)-dependent oxidoreductase [Jiangella alkaliphila]SDU19210.1 Short-chain dehydrogenase [Jiangella alkaliphila]
MSPTTVLITGATDGLGRWLALRLASTGVGVVLHGRNPARLDETAREIRAEGGRDPVGVVRADLADLGQVDRLADEVLSRFPGLDILVNNAGVGFGEPGGRRELSPDGIELRFAVNYLAGYHLTRRLLPALLAAAPARIVNVSSIGQAPIDFADPMLDHDYDGYRAYRQSKLAQIMFTLDLAEELRGTGVTANTLHPATLMATSMVSEAELTPLSTLHDGGEATLRLVADPELADVSGVYFDQTMAATPHAQALDPAARRRLRELTEQLVAQTLAQRT